VAGDTYDVLLRNGTLIATVTDVSGKGVGAGMIASGVHAGVRLLTQDDPDLTELACRLNSYLAGSTADNRFATFAMVQVDRDGTLSGVNAGHCPILIQRRDRTVDQIDSSGLPLGILGSASYQEAGSRLEPGDLLFLYTDGLTEAENPAGEEFSVERVTEVVSAMEPVGADEACERLIAEVDRFTEGQPLADDATLLVVERLLDYS
jgi:sigma-B regulation protein RsbU (phosphoserine phosphatase)